jgi:hypothetical protein
MTKTSIAKSQKILIGIFDHWDFGIIWNLEIGA